MMIFVLTEKGARMRSRDYELPNGKIAVFEYDDFGIGQVTLECMDELMVMIADRPLRHGHWENVADEYVGEYKLQKMLRCSECNYEIWIASDEMNPNYCSNCGAKMSDENNE